MIRPVLFAAGLAAALAAGAARAQVPVPGALQPATVSLFATGETRLAPDMATITLGVSATALTAREAGRLDAERMARVIAALKAAGLAGRDVQTANLSLQAQYAYAEGKPPRLTGYQASNSVAVRVRDLAKLPAAVDAATDAGADNVGGIALGIADPSTAEDAARRAAVKTLQARAALYADALGQRIGRLASLSEGGGYQPEPPRPMMKMAFAARAPAESTPVEAGEVTVRVEVAAVYELAGPR